MMPVAWRLALHADRCPEWQVHPRFVTRLMNLNAAAAIRT